MVLLAERCAGLINVDEGGLQDFWDLSSDAKIWVSWHSYRRIVVKRCKKKVSKDTTNTREKLLIYHKFSKKK
jgi:hypothetical protein